MSTTLDASEELNAEDFNKQANKSFGGLHGG